MWIPHKRSSIYTGPRPSREERAYAMLCHLLAILSFFIGPLVIWFFKRDSSRFVKDQGKEAINFWITVTLVFAGCFGLMYTPYTGACVFGAVALFVWLAAMIFAVMASVKASEGIAYRYPLTLRLIK